MVCKMKDPETKINIKQQRRAEADSSEGRLIPGVCSSLLSANEADSLVEADSSYKQTGRKPECPAGM